MHFPNFRYSVAVNGQQREVNHDKSLRSNRVKETFKYWFHTNLSVQIECVIDIQDSSNVSHEGIESTLTISCPGEY